MILENKIYASCALFEEIGNSIILTLEVGKYMQNFTRMFECVISSILSWVGRKALTLLFNTVYLW